MNPKPLTAILYFTVGCLVATILFVSHGTAQDDTPQPPEVGNPALPESVRVRYARAYLELAKTDLDIALNMNKQIGRAHV